MLWHMGDDIPNVPAKKTGGFCLGNKIAPIFYNTLQDSGALPIELDVENLNHGQKLFLNHMRRDHDKESGEVVSKLLKSEVLLVK